MTQQMKRDTAFKYSFMLYIPMSLAAMLLEVGDLLDASINTVTWIYYGVAMLVAAVVTFLVTKWFRNIVNNGKLIYFTIYCSIVGILVILFL